MSTTTHQGAEGAETMTAGSKAVSARTLAGMLRSRIERAAEHKSETVSLGQFFADQIHRYLTEAGHGPEHDARIGDVPADGDDPDCDRGRDWGVRARQVHLEALSKRAAGGKWFASTNGADGLARLDNGTDGMFPVRGEWHEIEFVEALVNAYRNGDLATPAQPAGAVPDSLREALEFYAYGRDISCEHSAKAKEALRDLDNLPEPVSAVVPDSLRALSEAAGPGKFKVVRGLHDYAVVAEASDRKGSLNSVDADFAAASANFVRSLIASHPAGQSTGQGAKRLTRAELEPHINALEDWLVEKGGLGLWAAGTASRRLLLAEDSPLCLKPAPDSPLTGPVGTEERIAALAEWLAENHGAGPWSSNSIARLLILHERSPVSFHALAARPAAPEAQGAWARRDAAVAALKSVHAIVCEAAMTGFNCHDGDWADRLFRSQQQTSEAIRNFEPGYRRSQPAPPTSSGQGVR